MKNIITIVHNRRAFKSLYNSIKEAICKHNQKGMVEYTMFFDSDDSLYLKVIQKIRKEGYSITIDLEKSMLIIGWERKEHQ